MEFGNISNEESTTIGDPKARAGPDVSLSEDTRRCQGDSNDTSYKDGDSSVKISSDKGKEVTDVEICIRVSGVRETLNPIKQNWHKYLMPVNEKFIVGIRKHNKPRTPSCTFVRCSVRLADIRNDPVLCQRKKTESEKYQVPAKSNDLLSEKSDCVDSVIKPQNLENMNSQDKNYHSHLHNFSCTTQCCLIEEINLSSDDDEPQQPNNSQELMMPKTVDQRAIEIHAAHISNNDSYKDTVENLIPPEIMHPCMNMYNVMKETEVSSEDHLSDNGPMELPNIEQIYDSLISQNNMEINALMDISYESSSSDYKGKIGNVSDFEIWDYTNPENPEENDYIELINYESPNGNEFQDLFVEKSETVFPPDVDSLCLNDDKGTEETNIQSVVSSESTSTDDGNVISRIR